MSQTDILKNLGLNDSEIRVYLSLLEMESSTVGPIIDKAKVTDSKIYMILEKLKEKGLVSYVVKNNVKHFQASDPENIISLITQREEELSKQKQEVKDYILPWIEKRRKLTEDRQEAVIYESYDGIKAAFNLILDNLEKGDEYYVFGLGDSLAENKIIWFFKTYHEKRIEKGIRVKLISEKRHKNDIESNHKYKGMDIRYVNQNLPIGTFIFANYVMTVVWGEKPTAFVIKSKQNADYYRNFFEDMWKKSKN